MTNLYSVLRKPIITKKSSILLKTNKLTFEVSRDTNKQKIKEAFKALFNITKIKVRIIIVRGKKKRMGKKIGKTKNKKKAIITLDKKLNANQFILQN